MTTVILLPAAVPVTVVATPCLTAVPFSVIDLKLLDIAHGVTVMLLVPLGT